MSNTMGDNKEHFSARISNFLIQKIKDKAKSEGKSVTAIVEDAFLQYFKDELPGLCKSCRYMNEPLDRFCSRCGKPLIEEAEAEYFNNFEEFWWKEEHFDRIVKILKDHVLKIVSG
ncbi:MAG: hypothetical protein LUQ50_03625 [Methanospirillum sp.]|uniref:hypothetical protein n=1 Tax=Methanospirillum sp. TaxID=45200 RepID=UPI00236C9F9A|nr:hypothetical protein [Methanospirillum sp.]MDD1728143.1 hypothetical protein [Methanospirillum sp.]